MTGSGARTPLAAPALRKGRRMLVLLALVTIAPVVASYAAYYFIPRDKQANHGELLATGPAPDVAGTRGGGQPFRLAELNGQWVLVVAATGGCDAGCTQALYATRQARTMQGREQQRIARVLLVTDGTDPAPSLLDQHAGLIVAKIAPGALSRWPAGADRIYVLDPRGNFVLAFPRAPDIKGLALDLTRLLKASRIG